MTSPRVLVVGSANMDLLLRIEKMAQAGQSILGKSVETAPGGKGANAAVAASKLGAQVAFCGCIGDDENGRILIQTLQDHGVDTQFVHVLEGQKSGLAVIPIEENGQNRILIFQGANAHMTFDMAQKALDQPWDAVLLQLEIPIETVSHILKWAKQHGVLSVLDAGPAMALPLESMGRIDILSPNATETLALCGIDPLDEKSALAACQKIMESGDIGMVVLKLGQDGCYVYRQGVGQHLAAFTVNAIDPTAAGDTFTAAFAIAFCKSKDINQAAGFACAAGALATTRIGAQPSLPTLQEVNTFLATVQCHDG